MTVGHMLPKIGCLLLVGATIALAESRARHYTPEELFEQSTLVFKGRVLEVTLLDKYNVSFPTRATVDEFLKGRWRHKEVVFKHKNPGLNVIYEQEFSKPEKDQKGTFYLEVRGKDLILIGYIQDTEPPAGGDGNPAPQPCRK